MTEPKFRYEFQQIHSPGIQVIYNNVSRFFNVSFTATFSTRERNITNVRHWTIFIAKCKGYSNSEVAGFFQKNTSVVQYVVNKKMDEIYLYPDSKKTFEHFIASENLILSYKALVKSKLKYWLRKYYKQYVREVKDLASKNAELAQPESIKTVKTLLQYVQNNKKRIYRHLVTARDHHTIENAIKVLDNVLEKYQSNVENSKRIKI